MNPNGSLQFGATNDFNGATFQTIETENVSFADNINCKCEGGATNLDASYTGWSAWDKVCPAVTDTTLPDSAFTITRTRARTYNKTKQELAGGVCPQATDNAFIKQTETVSCPRNCVGAWSGWSACNTACPGNAVDNNGTSTKTSSGGQATQTSTYAISKTALGTGTVCSNQNGDTKSQNCNTGVACTVNCTGGNWGGWYGCTAPGCLDPNNGNVVSTTSGTQYRNWENAKGPFNNGAACPAIDSTSCSNTCQINCQGDWTGCDRVFGTDLQTYYRRKDAANGGNGNCPGHGAQQWCDGQTNNGRMCIKTWGNYGTGSWWCLHSQEGYPANGRGLVLYQGCAFDSDKNRLRYNIASDGIIRHNYWTEFCLGNNGQSEGGYVRPTWGSGNCIKFGTGGGGIIRSKGGNYHNYCLQPITDNNSNSTSVVLKPCTMDIVF